MAHKFLQTLLLITSLLGSSVYAEAESLGPDIDRLLKLRQQADSIKDAGAVVLSRRGEVIVDENGLETNRFYNAIYIASEEAVTDYSKMLSSFNAYYYDKKIDFARVITASGDVYNMKEDAISIVAPNSDDYLDDMKQFEFAVPQLKVGNIIEYQSSARQTAAIIEGEWYSEISFHFIKFLPQKNWLRVDPVLETINTVTLPKSSPLHFVNRNIDIQPQVTETDKTKTYTWRNSNIPELALESSMPAIDDSLPSVYLSTMSKWQTIDSWFSRLFTPTQTGAANVAQLAKRLYAGLESDKEKVKAVFDYMQKNVRYIGAHVNRGGYQPHAASEVLENAYGDCKDQATLIIALLNEANIAAYPVMINTYAGSKIIDELPLLNFNHMITYVDSKDGEFWLDTSGKTGTFPGISGFLGGKKAFVVNGEQGKILSLPEVTPEDNVAKISIDFEFEGADLDVDVQMDLYGQVETNLRNYVQFSPEKLTAIEQILSPFVYENRVSDYQTTDPVDISVPFVINGQFNKLLTLEDGIETFRYSFDYIKVLNVFTSLSQLTPIANRHQDFEIQIPITVEVESLYRKPWQGAKLSHTDMASNIQNKYFEITHQMEEREDMVISRAKFVLYKQVVAASDYADFFAKIESLKKDNQSLFVYQRVGVESESDGEEENDVESQIAKTKTLLDEAKFEEALSKLEKLAKTHAKNAEIHYLLGLSYGFNGNDSLSEQSFKRAEELGYKF